MTIFSSNSTNKLTSWQVSAAELVRHVQILGSRTGEHMPFMQEFSDPTKSYSGRLMIEVSMKRQCGLVSYFKSTLACK